MRHMMRDRNATLAYIIEKFWVNCISEFAAGLTKRFGFMIFASIGKGRNDMMESIRRRKKTNEKVVGNKRVAREKGGVP